MSFLIALAVIVTALTTAATGSGWPVFILMVAAFVWTAVWFLWTDYHASKPSDRPPAK